MKSSKIDKNIVNKIISLYLNDIKSLTQIGKLVDLHRKTISFILQEYNIPVRPSHFYAKGRKQSQVNKEKFQARLIEWRKTNKQIAHNKLSIDKRMYNIFTQRAKKIDKELTLTKEEILILLEDICYYCGEIPKMRFVYRMHAAIHGIDRIDSNIGYTKENSVTCCTMCNIMKNDYTFDEFINKIEMINNKLVKRLKNR